MTEPTSPLQTPAPNPPSHTPRQDGPVSGDSLYSRLLDTRDLSNTLAAPLTDEDQAVQACDDASPTKWHLAHTTWFLESFVLTPHVPGYQIYSQDFEYCFNSYYEAKGDRHPRASRGLLTRPTASEVRTYRAHVDDALTRLAETDLGQSPEIRTLIELGINHEQQHQELLLTDILALFAAQPLNPAYTKQDGSAASVPADLEAIPPNQQWVWFDGGIYAIGHDGTGFSYDNESPRHDILMRPFCLSSRLVTNAEWADFIEDGGYARHDHWLADGWSWVKTNNIKAPGYWEQTDEGWQQMTLHGRVTPHPASPVTNVSYYEADAFAKWSGKRLPTESEWEIATAKSRATTANTLATGAYCPRPAARGRPGLIDQMFGDCWEWTQSAYLPYPGYRAPEGAVGEYNGKFMCGQQVLRGASFATAGGHSRATYRNFFYPHQRWQFMGLRLAEDA